MPKSKKNNTVSDEYNKPFAARLRNLIDESNVSQASLAENIGVTRQAISSYTLGLTLPDIEKFQKISDYFSVSYDYLLGKSESKQREYIDISDKLGLSDSAINNLIELKNRVLEDESQVPKAINFADYLISSSEFVTLMLEGNFLRRLKLKSDDYFKRFNRQLAIKIISEKEVLEKATTNLAMITHTEYYYYKLDMLVDRFKYIVQETLEKALTSEDYKKIEGFRLLLDNLNKSRTVDKYIEDSNINIDDPDVQKVISEFNRKLFGGGETNGNSTETRE